MDEVRVRRNGKGDLCFKGRELARVDEREWMFISMSWFVVTLYKTEVGKYILASDLFFRSLDRRDLHGCITFSSALEFKAFIKEEGLGRTRIGRALLERAAARDSALAVRRRTRRSGAGWSASEPAPAMACSGE
ncbi:MAG: hypothetical protein PHV85_03605 [Desulfovibrionaceae bacterium]|nr:hypothetical protein [Desulfovibrionaceae bacterium]